MNTPIEVLEMSFPVRVEEYAILPDSGGAGRWRGGCGARRAWRILDHESRAAICCERTVSAPFGLAGGGAGPPASLPVELPDGASRRIGRTSCRERVCQYVYVSVVVGSLQHKITRITIYQATKQLVITLHCI